jgi:hypothetical protein
LQIGFIDQFTTRLLITLNYSAITDFYILQITTAHGNSFQSPIVSTSRSLVTALTVRILQLHRPSLLFTDFLTTANWQLSLLQLTVLLAPIILLITYRHRPHRKHRFSVAVPLLLIKNIFFSSGHFFVVCFEVVTQ